MSNDYAMFIILLPNDFKRRISTISALSQSPLAKSINTISAQVAPTPLTQIASLSSTLINDEETDEHFQRAYSNPSLCLALKNYISTKDDIEAVWILSADTKKYQVTFDAEFGLVSDRILQDLIKLGIGRKDNTKVTVLPTTIILEGQIDDTNESVSILPTTEDGSHYNLVANQFENDSMDPTSNGLPSSRKTRRGSEKPNFKKSVRARLMVHQVVASIRAGTALSFDFVVLIILASMLAAFGLLENSSVIIVASMLVSPLMNPILGIVFGMSVREHSLWRRGFRNELIGLVICVTCGFILGLFTTFAETKWGNSTTFPTPEMKSRGDVKRLWVGVLIALPSGAGVALSVLGGNTGSLVGVAISASLLPPAVNCGLLFAYAVLGASFDSIATVRSYSINETNADPYSSLNCSKYIRNDYQPLYTCNLAAEAAILACSSLLLTIVNIVCIIIMALFILRIKEVVPLYQSNEDIVKFFHHDVKVARDYNKTIREEELEPDHRTYLAQSIVQRWKSFKSVTGHENQQDSEAGASRSTSNPTDLTDTESRRQLLRLQTFAKDYDLDVFNTNDYDLLTAESRERAQLLINDLADMCQEVPNTFIGLYHLQPCPAPTSTDRGQATFYEEIIALLPPKWYQLFVREQQRRKILSASTTVNRTYSLCSPPRATYHSSMSEPNENDSHSIVQKESKKTKKLRFQRQNSVPGARRRSSSTPIELTNQEIPVEGTRFRIIRPSVTTPIFEDAVFF